MHSSPKIMPDVMLKILELRFCGCDIAVYGEERLIFSFLVMQLILWHKPTSQKNNTKIPFIEWEFL